MSRTTDYDSRLVDGRYVTSVPIIDDVDDVDEGNLRPVHRAPPMSANGKTLRFLIHVYFFKFFFITAQETFSLGISHITSLYNQEGEKAIN